MSPKKFMVCCEKCWCCVGKPNVLVLYSEITNWITECFGRVIVFSGGPRHEQQGGGQGEDKGREERARQEREEAASN